MCVYIHFKFKLMKDFGSHVLNIRKKLSFTEIYILITTELSLITDG